MVYLYLVLSFCLNATANILLKLGAKKGIVFHGLGFLELFKVNYLPILGLASFAFSALFYFMALKAFPISVIYPMLVGMAFIIINIFAVVFLHERITWPQVAGYACLLLGMVLIFVFNSNR